MRNELSPCEIYCEGFSDALAWLLTVGKAQRRNATTSETGLTVQVNLFDGIATAKAQSCFWNKSRAKKLANVAGGK